MKMTFRVAQVALVLAVGGLTVLIFMRGRQDAATVTKESNDLKANVEQSKKRKTRGGSSTADASKFNLKAYRQQQISNLPDSAQKTVRQLPELTPETDTLVEHRYVEFWQGASNPLLAGHYQQRLAKQADLPGTWTRAGQFFQKLKRKPKIP